MHDPCCNVPELNKQATAEERGIDNIVYLQIHGINCRNCANRVRNALLSTYGVTTVIIEPVGGLAEVRFHPALTSTETLKNAVRSAGGDGVHEYSAQVLRQE